MMAPAMTAPPITPAAIPGPHPHPRCHQAEASVAVAATITTIVAAPSKLTMVFLINVSLIPSTARAANANTRPPLASMKVCSSVRGGAPDRGSAATRGTRAGERTKRNCRHAA
jgi:hypothetical protein